VTREVIVDTTDYIGSIHQEEFEDGTKMVFVHMDIFYWAPSVLKHMIKTWPIFREGLKDIPLFCMADDDNEKWERYISRFGFQYLSDIPCSDGKIRRLFVNYP
jgi:hypothetical protein